MLGVRITSFLNRQLPVVVLLLGFSLCSSLLAADKGLFPTGVTDIVIPLGSQAETANIDLEYSAGLIPRIGDIAELQQRAENGWQTRSRGHVVGVTAEHIRLRLKVPKITGQARVRIRARPIHRCDLVAASPFDKYAVTPGVEFSEISISAIEHCGQAVSRYPQTARFYLQLGRALDAHEQYKPAVARYRQALNLEPEYSAAALALSGKYLTGEGVDQDVEVGLLFLKKAEAQSLPRASYVLGQIAEQGAYGQAADPLAAKAYFTKAAEGGDLLAQLYLVEMLETPDESGVVVEPAYSEALYWREKAAEQGDVESAFRLGNAYAQGQRRPQDWVKARQWWDRAANQGLPQAQVALGGLYEQGLGLEERELSKAMYWYRQAARQEYAQGQYELGRMYAEGIGVEPDIEEARVWLKLAYAQGVDEAARWLEPEPPVELEGSEETDQIVVAEVKKPKLPPRVRSSAADLEDVKRWHLKLQGYMDDECREELYEDLEDMDIRLVPASANPEVELIISINSPEYYQNSFGPLRFSGYHVHYRGEVIRLNDSIRMFYTHGDEEGDDRTESCVDAIDEIMDELEDEVD